MPATDRRSVLDARTRYAPEDVEPRILRRWEEADAFTADPDARGTPYCICLPPPNITGALHMGHALNISVQDALIRLKRMQGFNVLWQPGTDHAGIATQMVVERQLAAEGLTRHDLGRERFVERVWTWREESGAQIVEQSRILGASLDYGRQRFTMDPAYARAVQEVFLRLHERGLIYRGERLVNWSVPLGTAVSDLEVEHRETADRLYRVRYAVEGGGEIVVATVRPVTILADVAIAVHPDDERYRGLVGRRALVPLVDRWVPIIADERVERGFGTGALKITPGHDPTDFEIGQDHGLPTLSMLRVDGTLTDLRPDWAGLPVAEGAERALAELRTSGALLDEQPYTHSVGYCARSGARIEPLVSLQWFCRMDELAEPALAAVRDGRLRFHPRGAERIFFDWTEQIRPWCISRQLWWGHRLPVWFAPDGSYVVSIGRPDGEGWEQSTDVLDTWFSSALWPYATLGWPEDTPELRTWYPGDVVVTAREIINLWVGRMAMTGLEFLHDIPFRDVYVTTVVQAADGRRMSKSAGNGVDPRDLVDRFGADATRYGMLKMSSTQDVRFSEGVIDEGRALANKLWNASRLVLLNVPEGVEAAPMASHAVDRWILSRLDRAIESITAAFEAFDLAAAVKELYSFAWNEFCDWYLEAVKLRLYGDDAGQRDEAAATALFVLERLLALAHPAMPHVTEEIWSFVPGSEERGLLMRRPFPQIGEVGRDAEAERSLGLVFELVSTLRRLRAESGLAPREPLSLAVAGDVDATRLVAQADLLDGLGRGVVEHGDPPADAVTVPVVVGDATVRVGGPGLAAALRDRLRRRRDDAVAERDRAAAKLANERFVTRAPEPVVAEERARYERFATEAAELERQLEAVA